MTDDAASLRTGLDRANRRVLVLFDVDGTLLDAAGAGRAAIEAAMVEVYGTSGPIDELAFDGLTDPQIVRTLLLAAGLAEPEIDGRLFELWGRYADLLTDELDSRGARATTTPGVPGLLDALAGLGVWQGLVTGNIAEGARRKLDACGLAGRFEFGAYGCDAEDRDALPPIALSRAFERTGIRFGREETWIVGDTPRDVACAHAAGLRALGVATGRFSPSDLDAAGADRVVASLADTDEVLSILSDRSRDGARGPRFEQGLGSTKRSGVPVPEGTMTSGTRRRWTSGAPREFTFDVLVDGRPVRRSAPVRVVDETVRIGDEALPLDAIFWVSRRAGLVLLFARDRTVALLGASGDLEELARTVERGSNRAAQRSLLQPLAREVVVCTAGTAASGTWDDVSVSGLHLAVFTQQALHLFAGTCQHRVPWPVQRVSEINTVPGEPGRSGLRLSADGLDLTLRYLFPEEIQAVARVARRSPKPVGAPDGALELFAKGEVAPPPPAELPEFTLSAETLQAACLEAASRVPHDPSLGVRFDGGYFERHFQELGEIALGPLMLRRSAAVGAASMAHAVEAMDAEQLRQDATAAFHGAADRLFQVFRGEVEQLVLERRLRPEVRQAARASEERAGLADAMSGRMDALEPAYERVLARQHLLLQRLQAREHAPPDTEDTGVEEATQAWQSEISKLDRAYGIAWGEVLEAMADVWSDGFLPRLRELAARPRRRLSEGARLAILAAVTFVIMAGLAVWLF